MAVVQNSWTGDFLLYQREPNLHEMPPMAASDPLAGYDFGGAGTLLSPHYEDLATTSFDSAAPVAAYYDMPASFVFDEPKTFSDSAPPARAVTRYTPSESPATSLTHTIDQANSTYSHPSGPSGSSSAMGSPYPAPGHDAAWMEAGIGLDYSPAAFPGVSAAEVEAATFGPNFVDPTLISYDGGLGMAPPAVPAMFPTPPSPVPSNASSQDSHVHRIGPSRHHSPAVPYVPYARSPFAESRWGSGYEAGSPFVDRDAKGRCHECGRTFRDLKAHQLTHQSERPEKCPIPTCEYHTKGFARKYDRCRHTLTHYKGTMVCDFCPGGGSAAEKSFNRADVFKRHLTSVHGVEQNPPNSRRRTSGQSPKKAKETTMGKCSTCSAIFNNAQDLYDHLDDCVLRSLEQAEPSEAINAQHLNGVAQDADVQAALERVLPAEAESESDSDEDTKPDS